jgi:hypothetical protein
MELAFRNILAVPLIAMFAAPARPTTGGAAAALVELKQAVFGERATVDAGLMR